MTIEARDVASQPGALQVNIQANGKAAAGTLQVLLTDAKGQAIAQQTIAGFTWPKAGLIPGIYNLAVEAPGNANVVPVAHTVVIKPAEISTVPVSL